MDPSDFPPSCYYDQDLEENICDPEGFYPIDDWISQELIELNGINPLDMYLRYADYVPTTIMSLNYTNAPIFQRDSNHPSSTWDPVDVAEHTYFNFTNHASSSIFINEGIPTPEFSMFSIVGLIQNMFNVLYYRLKAQEVQLYKYTLKSARIQELSYYLDFGVPEFGYPFLFICFAFIMMMNAEVFLGERENKLKGNLELYGLKQWSFFLSWWVTFFISCFIVSIVTYLTMAVTVNPVAMNNSFFAFLFLAIGWSFISSSYSLFLTSFFSTSKIGVMIIVILILFTPMTYAMLDMTGSNYGFLDFLYPVFSLCRGIGTLTPMTPFSSNEDGSPTRVPTSALFTSWTNMNDNVRMYVGTLTEMFVYGVIYFLIGTYLSLVIPHEGEIPKDPLFFITDCFTKDSKEEEKALRMKQMEKSKKSQKKNVGEDRSLLSYQTDSDSGLYGTLPPKQPIPAEQPVPEEDHASTASLLYSLSHSVIEEKRRAMLAKVNETALVVKNLNKIFKIRKKVKEKDDQDEDSVGWEERERLERMQQEQEEDASRLQSTIPSVLSPSSLISLSGSGSISSTSSSGESKSVTGGFTSFTNLSASNSDHKIISSYFQAVDDVSFVVPNNEVFGLLGANGAGKSTTISMICGQLRPSSGHVWIGGKCVTRSSKERREATTKVGIVFQFDRLWPSMTVYEHIELYCNFNDVYNIALKEEDDLRQRDELSLTKSGRLKNAKILSFMSILPSSCSESLFIHRYIMHIVKRVGLAHATHRRVSALSGGMRRRVSIGISLVGSPSLILLDEFSSGLDPHTKHEVWDLLPVLREGRAVLLTTHDMQEAEALCDRICIINRGNLVCLDDSVRLVSMFEHNAVLRVTLSKYDPSEIIRCCGEEKEDKPSLKDVSSTTASHNKAIQFPDDVLGDGFLASDLSSVRIEDLKKEYYKAFHDNKLRVESCLQSHLGNLDKLTDSGGIISYTIPLKGKRGILLRCLRSLEREGVIVEWTLESASLETVFGVVVGGVEG
ncbi:ABC transporter A like protein [Aduncisulcus paluster]|uniref:ABC transporter A like protein n=1 Tax=Aduncisulcus paluster TaxID=2918883 RepID=A0ABQ5KQN7_9EUKA|nr:ABC transporter A like protein [Aduncisulcus paluster]